MVHSEVMGDRLQDGWSTLESTFLKLGLEHIVRETVDSDRVPETRNPGTDNQIAVRRSTASMAHRIRWFRVSEVWTE